MTSPSDTNTNFASDAEIINDEQFDEMHDLLEDDFAELLQVFITDSHQRIQKLRDAQKNADNANGFEIAHALKGASANLGATQLMSLSGQLQEHSREQAIAEQSSLIEELSLALQRVEQAIKQKLER